jgi:hypothetical protein
MINLLYLLDNHLNDLCLTNKDLNVFLDANIDLLKLATWTYQMI